MVSLPDQLPPQRATYNHNGDGIIIKDGGHILHWELVRCVRNKQASLSDGTITDNHALDGLTAHYYVRLMSTGLKPEYFYRVSK